MKINREILEEQLNTLINLYANNRNIRKDIIKYYDDKGCNIGFVADILALRIALKLLNDLDLGLCTSAMHRALKNQKGNSNLRMIDTDIPLINPNRFFDDIELKQIRDYSEESIETPLYPIVFEDVSILDRDQFSLSIPIQKIAELCDKKALIYNHKTQRALKIRKFSGSIIKSIDINNISVRSIRDEILKGLFIPNHITLNVLETGSEKIKYDAKNRKLTIVDGEINILDGMHRILGIVMALNKDKKIELRMGLKITNFDIAKANKYIVQENKKNIMNEDHIKQIDVDNMSNLITKKLNEDVQFHLSGNMTINNILIGNEKKIKLPIITDSISYTFNPQNKKEFVRDYSLIRDRLNYIIEKESYLFDSPVKNQYTWTYYICLIYISRNIEDWGSFINKNLFFEIENLKIKSISKNSINKIFDVINLNDDNLEKAVV